MNAMPSMRSADARLRPGARPWRAEREDLTMAKDPVCGMQVDEKKAAAREQYEGTTWYFCSAGCHKRFLEIPRSTRHRPARRNPERRPSKGRCER